MNILICNDDGVNAEGIRCLYRKMAEAHNVLVVAPDTERSASGHSVTLRQAVRLVKKCQEQNLTVYSLSGTPVDCVKFGLFHFNEFHADIVVSGINKGANVATDVIYSGTVGCAREAASHGLPAIAVSVTAYENNIYEPAAEFIACHIDALFAHSKPYTFFNVNVPNLPKNKLRGARFAPLGRQTYDETYDVAGEEYSLRGYPVSHAGNDADCDVELIARGYIAVTPLLVDATDRESLAGFIKEVSLQ